MAIARLASRPGLRDVHAELSALVMFLELEVPADFLGPTARPWRFVFSPHSLADCVRIVQTPIPVRPALGPIFQRVGGRYALQPLSAPSFVFEL